MLTSYKPQHGDILAFSGNGLSSCMIKVRSIWSAWYLGHLTSHVGWCIQRDDNKVALFESTTLSDLPDLNDGAMHQGVQVVSPEDRINSYNGKIWAYRMLPYTAQRFAPGQCDGRKLMSALEKRWGEPYDLPFALLAGSIILQYLIPWSEVDKQALFCSEYLTDVAKRAHMLNPETNSSLVKPSTFVHRMCVAGNHSKLGRVK